MTKAIMVGSLKGGTGKTTLATSIARELENATVADCDIDSSNFASIFGVAEKAEVTKNHKIKPVSTNGIDIYSAETFFEDSTISLKQGQEQKIVDRLIHHAVQNDTEYLVIDCPPGASSSFRAIVDSLSERDVPRALVVVNQPNTLTDLQRLVVICNHLKLPIVGFVENMSGVADYDIAPFGKGGVEKAVNNMNGNFFGRIPLAPKPERREEMVEPVAEEIVNYVRNNNPFMDKKTYVEPGFWDKLRSGINIGLNAMSSSLPIGELGDQYGFERDNLSIQIHIPDLDKKINFGVRGDDIKPVKNPKNLAGGIKIPLRELKDALGFKREVMYSPTGEEREMDYSITEAVKLGFAEVWTNDDLDIGEEVDAWDMLVMLEYILKEHIGLERIKEISEEVGVDQI